MSESVTSRSTWRVTSASCKGSSHGDDAPNQDAVQFVSVKDGADADVWVAAVSDGHGGRRYVRSDVGSALAVGVAVTHLAEVVRTSEPGTSFEDLLRREVPAIVGVWRESVLSHVQTHPFTETEAARAGVDLEHDPVVAYGATLLVVVVGEDGVGLAQIGDGDALIRTHGFATRPVPGDARLVAGETTSLCLESAVSDFRFAALPGSSDPDLILLASDGYANSFADKDWWRAVVGDLAWFLADRGFDDFAVQFPAWLGESATVGGDDVSAVVIARSPLVVPPEQAPAPAEATPVASQPVPEPAAVLMDELRPVSSPGPLAGAPQVGTLVDEPGDDTAYAASPEERRRRRTLAWVVAALVLVVAVVLAWVVTGGFGGAGGPSSPGPSPTVSTPGHTGHRHPSGGGNNGPDNGGRHGGPGGGHAPAPGTGNGAGSGMTGAAGPGAEAEGGAP